MDNDTIGYIVLFAFWLLSQLASAAKKKPGQSQSQSQSQGQGQGRGQGRGHKARPRLDPRLQAPSAPPVPTAAPTSAAGGLEQEAEALSARLERLVAELRAPGEIVDDEVHGQVVYTLEHGVSRDVEDARAELDKGAAAQSARELSQTIERGLTLESFLETLLATAKTHTSLRRKPERRTAHLVADRVLREFRDAFVPHMASTGTELAEAPPAALIWDLDADDRLASSPLAGSTVFLPRSVAKELLHWTSLPYELARYLGDACPGLYREVYDKLGLAVTEPNVIANPDAFARLLFSSYIVRLLGDATGASLFGPTYLRALARMYARPSSPAQVTTIYLNQDGTIHPEPPAHLRLRWTASWLGEMGYADEAEETLRAWTAQHEDPQEIFFGGTTGAIPLEPIAASTDALVKQLFRLEPQALGGRQVAELPGLSDWGASERRWVVARRAFASGEPADGPARALLAGAMQAAEEAPGDERTIRQALYDSLGDPRSRKKTAGLAPKRPSASRAAAGPDRPAAHSKREGRGREIAEALVLADILLDRPARPGPPGRRVNPRQRRR